MASNPTHVPDDAPHAPTLVLEPGGGSARDMARDVWAYRELLAFLVWRDLKVRYRQTVLGVAWVLIQPALTVLIFTVFFGSLAGVPSEGLPYPVFALAGILPWSFFSAAVTSSGASLVNSSSLVGKVYFPRVLIPASAVASSLVDFALGGLLVAVVLPLYGARPGASIALLPLVVGAWVLLAFGTGTFLAAVNVKYRDVRYALPFALQIWMFLSPVIYPSSIVPARWKWLFGLNPLVGLVDAFRAALVGREPEWSTLLVSLGAAAAAVAAGLAYFRRVERSFADVL
jgi:lipopolysaccharide transport system permease protein